MILMYHKVDIVTPSRWWVSVERFESQINALRKTGHRFVYLEDYDHSNKLHAAITFDDAYENVFRHAFPILKKRNLPFEIFVIGDKLGEWNEYDKSEMRTRFCSLKHLQEMAECGGRMQWHTKNHLELPKLSDEEMESELQINQELAAHFSSPHFSWFAYPYGLHDERSYALVRERFQAALSVEMGSDSDRFALNRVTVDENWMPS
jgi:peptidoglycan/xylan/chitin deacetylase (PgdA/CDA1 family)